MTKLGILLADDHETVREGLKVAINAQPDMQVIAEAPDGDAAIATTEALTPEIVGTSYDQLSVSVDDTDGYVVEAEPNGWRAVFGQYTPNLRPVDIFDRQVQCLRARVGQDEQLIQTIFLAPLEEGCGTYLPRTTPAPVESASPTPAN